MITTEFLIPKTEMIKFDKGFTFFFGIVDNYFNPLQ